MLTPRGFVVAATVCSMVGQPLAARLGDAWGSAHQNTILLRAPVAAACLAFENEDDASVRKHASQTLFYLLHALDDALTIGRAHQSHPTLGDAGWLVYDVAYAGINAKRAWNAYTGTLVSPQDDKKDLSGVLSRIIRFIPILWEIQASQARAQLDDDQHVQNLADLKKGFDEVLDKSNLTWQQRQAGSKMLNLNPIDQLGSNNLLRALQEFCLAPAQDERNRLAFVVALCLWLLPKQQPTQADKDYWNNKLRAKSLPTI